MSKDTDFLDDFAGDVPAVVETPKQTEPEPKSDTGAARDDKGRFAKAGEKVGDKPAEPQPEAVAETGDNQQAEPSPALSPPPGEQKAIPESAFVQMRKDFQKKIDALERQLNERAQSATPKPPAQEPPPPDMFDDPQGYREWTNSQFEQRLQTSRLDTSEVIARQQFGDEKIDTALEALKSSGDQAAWQRILNEKHPYGALIKWHEKHQVMSQIEEAGGLEALIAAELAKRAPQQPAPGQVQEQPKPAPVTPPPSLAKGGAGNTATVEPSEEEDFRSVFSKR